jgi:diphosphomevalonate decarboxylase
VPPIERHYLNKKQATALAHPNIAFIKYWGDKDADLRIPVNGSLSMNLDCLYSRTAVEYDPDLDSDELTINEQVPSESAVQRVNQFLDHVRCLAGISTFASVTSENNFPTGSGIASSASGFAALSLAATAAVGLALEQQALSRLARRGSGSACRSVPGGFVEWLPGKDDESSYAISIAAYDHWDLRDCIAIVSKEHKETGSAAGHSLAGSSLLQTVRVEDAQRRLDICRSAIINRDFQAFADIVELDSNLMHAVMMTSHPQLYYWQPATLNVMQSVIKWRAGGVPVCFTIDAGPNVHVITTSEYSPAVMEKLNQIPGVIDVLASQPGKEVRLLDQ